MTHLFSTRASSHNSPSKNSSLPTRTYGLRRLALQNANHATTSRSRGSSAMASEQRAMRSSQVEPATSRGSGFSTVSPRRLAITSARSTSTSVSTPARSSQSWPRRRRIARSWAIRVCRAHVIQCTSARRLPGQISSFVSTVTGVKQRVIVEAPRAGFGLLLGLRRAGRVGHG